MAIQMRRGLRKDFDPNKMLPGEWAVSIDSSTSNQIVWMCFATGVCKRMGTYEDFQNMVYQATGEIIERYEENFGQILAEVKEVANDVKSDKEEVIYIKSEITDTYLPQIRQYISSASSSANSASADAVKAKASADAAKASEQNAKKSEEKAKTYADNASAVTGVQIATKEIAGLVKGGDNLIDEDGTLTLTKSTTERTLTNSYAGGIKINEICGESEQESTTGAQLYDVSAIYAQSEYVKIDSDGWITIKLDNTSGTQRRYHNINAPASELLEVSTTYAIVLEISSISNAEVVAASNTEDKEKGQFNGFLNASATGTFVKNISTFSSFEECKNISRSFISVGAGLSGSATFRISIIKDTTITANTFVYEKFTGGAPSPSPDYPQEIKSVEVSEVKVVGAQLLDTSAIIKNTAISAKVEDDMITVVGESGYSNAFFRIPNTRYFRGKKFTISFESCTQSVENAYVSLQVQITKPDNTIIYKVTSPTNNKMTFTVNEDAIALRVVIMTNNSSTPLETANTVVFKGIMFVEGETAKAWEPYQESIIKLSKPITLNGIGDTKDRIVRKDGVWGVERKFGNIVFDGSDDEKWHKDMHRLVTEMYVSKVKSRTLNVLCNMFSVATASEIFTKTKEGISIDSVGRIYIYDVAYLDSSLEANVNAWKAHLVEKQMTVLYELAEEVFEPLPESDQIALNSLVSFNTVTHIITDSGIEPIIEVEYGTSKVGAYTLDAWNTAKRNEIKNAQIEALITELATNTVAESEE